MKISVILAHPYDGSFNAAVAETVVNTLQRKGHEVWFHHLYREQFNPIYARAGIGKRCHR